MKRYWRFAYAFLLGVCSSLACAPDLDERVAVCSNLSSEGLGTGEEPGFDEDLGTPKDVVIKPVVPQPSIGVFKPSRLDVQVWFELPNGEIVNSLQRNWKPKDQFFIHVTTTKPVYVALFQVDSNDGSEILYPLNEDARNVLQKGVEKCLPTPDKSFAFTLDDVNKDENMSLVVVSADWDGIKDEIEESSDAGGQRIARLSENAINAMKAFSERVVSGAETSPEDASDLAELDKRARKVVESLERVAPRAEFRVASPETEASWNSEECSFYLSGTEDAGQWTFTLKKQKKDEEFQENQAL